MRYRIFLMYQECFLWFDRRRRRLRKKAIRLAVKLGILRPIYTIIWSRDCDMVEDISRRIFYSEKELKRYDENMARWADGPYSIHKITKDQYDHFEPCYRDRIAEAWENGRGRSVIV